jgi:hypothetical protein
LVSKIFLKFATAPLLHLIEPLLSVDESSQ